MLSQTVRNLKFLNRRQIFPKVKNWTSNQEKTDKTQ